MKSISQKQTVAQMPEWPEHLDPDERTWNEQQQAEAEQYERDLAAWQKDAARVGWSLDPEAIEHVSTKAEVAVSKWLKENGAPAEILALSDAAPRLRWTYYQYHGSSFARIPEGIAAKTAEDFIAAQSALTVLDEPEPTAEAVEQQPAVDQPAEDPFMIGRKAIDEHLTKLGHSFPSSFLLDLYEDADELLDTWIDANAAPKALKDLVNSMMFLYSFSQVIEYGTLLDDDAQEIPAYIALLAEAEDELR